MNVRNATLDDLAVIEELWRAFEAEVPPPAHEDVDPANGARRDPGDRGVAGSAGLPSGTAPPIGMALARRRGARVGRITDLYVVPTERRAGVADALLRAVAARLAEDGVDTIDLEVMASNAAARAVFGRWGFRDEVLVLAAPVAALVERLGVEAQTTSFGSIHVQTDDAT